MRHAVRGRKLARTKAHRLALRRNLVQSLIEHGEIRTTIIKAKEVRSFAERLITLAVRGDYPSRSRAEALLTDRSIIPADKRSEYDAMSDAKRERVLRSRTGMRYRDGRIGRGAPFTATSVIHKLFSEIGPRMKQRNEKLNSGGGYTRIIKLAERRLGDGGQLAILQLVSAEDKPREKLTAKTERRRKARVKYDVYAGKPRSPRAGRKTTKNSIASSSDSG